MPAPRNGGQRLIQRCKERASEPARISRSSLTGIPSWSSAVYGLAALLWLGQNGQSASVNSLENPVAPARQQCRPGLVAKFLGIIPLARIAQKLRTIGVGHDRFQVNEPPCGQVLFTPSSSRPVEARRSPPRGVLVDCPHFRERPDRYMAPSAQAVQQSTFARCGGAGIRIVEKSEQSLAFRIAFPNLNP